MTDDSESCDSDERSTNRTGRGAAVFAAVVLGYVLSPVPMAWCLMKIGVFEAVEPAWEVIYSPLGFLVDRFDFLNDFYEWQSELAGF